MCKVMEATERDLRPEMFLPAAVGLNTQALARQLSETLDFLEDLLAPGGGEDQWVARN